MRFLLPLALLALTAAPALAQNPGGEPLYGDVRLEEGFLPDPHEMEVTAGGSQEVSERGCNYGYVAEAPDVDLYYTTSGDSNLYIYAISSEDTTILVNLPDGSWACDDDSYGDGDPILVIPSADAGLYDIWIGTYGDDTVDATLYISEIDPR